MSVWYWHSRVQNMMYVFYMMFLSVLWRFIVTRYHLWHSYVFVCYIHSLSYFAYSLHCLAFFVMVSHWRLFFCSCGVSLGTLFMMGCLIKDWAFLLVENSTNYDLHTLTIYPLTWWITKFQLYEIFWINQYNLGEINERASSQILDFWIEKYI